jgi:dTDP-L-rhamnose 4-epimerase
MKKNILITGGAGFIGSNLALNLLSSGHTVTVLDNLSPQVHGDAPEKSPLFLSIKDKVEFIQGDVCDRQQLQRALKNNQIVVHLAAETGTGQSMYEIAKYTRVNVQGTALMLDVLANENIKVEKIVLASSRAVYGEGKYRCEEHGPIYPLSRSDENMSRGDFEVKCPICNKDAEALSTDENSLLHPSSIYGITKQIQEQLIFTIGKALQIPTVIFRYQNVYGPGQSLTNPYTGMLSIFSTRIRNGSGINIFEDGKESRDFVFIDDVVAATVRGIELEGLHAEVLNVGSGVASDVLSIANTLKRLLNGTASIEVSGQYRQGDIRHNFADLTKVRAVLGFEPSVTVEEGLRRFVTWVISELVQVDRYEESLRELQEKGLFK